MVDTSQLAGCREGRRGVRELVSDAASDQPQAAVDAWHRWTLRARSSSRQAQDLASSVRRGCSLGLSRSCRHRRTHRLTRMALSRSRRRRATAAIHHRDRDAPRTPGLPATRRWRRDRTLDEARQLASTQPPAQDLPADQRARIDPPSAGQPADMGPARSQCHVVQHQPPRRQRRAAPPPHPARADPRLVPARPAPRTIRSSPAPSGDATAEFSRRSSWRLLRVPRAIR